MRVFVTGGTGLVGVRLIRALRGRGDEVVVLSRRPDAYLACGTDCHFEQGDPAVPGAWLERLAGCDAVVHLAGANVLARRWTRDYKAQIHQSRVVSAAVLADALARNPAREDGSPKAFVSASAVGYYGARGDEPVTERDGPGTDFLARVCVDWEAAARQAEPAGVRVATVRVGVVLDRAGGALGPLVPMFKWFVGGRAGTGRQWMSWVHHADLVGIFLLALDHPDARGPVNGTAPNPVTNAEFARELGRALRRPSVVPAPAFALRLVLGERATALLTGQRVLPERATQLGYQFQFPLVGAALAHALREPAA